MRPFRRLNPLARPPAIRVEELEAREVPAATFTVTNTNDAGAGSLRQAVLDANAMAGFDIVVFQAGLTGPIVLTTGQITITGDVDIQGPGSALVTVNGNAAGRIFNVDNGAAGAIEVSISDLALTNGKVAAGLDGGAILLADEVLTLRRMLITNNEAGDDGGGIGNTNDGATLNVFDSTISGNKAVADGGGGIMLYGRGVVQNCVITGNTCGNDAAALYWDADAADTLTIENCTITGNTATNAGGALYTNGTGGTLVIRNTTLSGNRATNDRGGALYLSHSGTTTIENCTLSGNTAADGSGGGVHMTDGTVTVRNSTLSGNSAAGVGSDGGGIFVGSGKLIVENSTITLNTATDKGGGISETTATNPVLRNALVANNTAAADPDLDGTFDAGGSLIRTPGAAVINVVGGANLTGVDPLLGGLADNGGTTKTHALLTGSPAIGAGVNGLVAVGVGFDQRGPGFVRVLGTVDVGAVEVQPPTPLLAGGPLNGKAASFTPSAAGVYPAAATAAVSPFGAAVNVRIATGDVDGDGFEDTVAVTGPGTPIRVTVVSGKDNTTVLVPPFDPFGGDFLGGGFVATGDIDRDGRDEFVVTPDQGGGPRVTIFTLPAGTSTATVKQNFFGIDDPAFRGGARAALGDIDGDLTPDLAVGAGFLGGPRVAIFKGTTLFTTPTRLVGDFFGFPGPDATTLRNGVFLALGDVDGDNKDDLILGGGPGGAPRVFILSGAKITANDVAGAQASPVANFFVAGDSVDRGGIRLAATDADGDNKADVLAGSGEGRPSRVRIYLGKNFTTASEPATFQDIDPFAVVLPGGVFVG